MGSKILSKPSHSEKWFVWFFVDFAMFYLQPIFIRGKMMYKYFFCRKNSEYMKLKLPWSVNFLLFAYYIFLIKVARNFGGLGRPTLGGGMLSLGILISSIVLFLWTERK